MSLPNWLHLSQVSGTGDTTITITADTNSALVGRDVELIVSGISKHVTVLVEQENRTPDLSLAPSMVSVATASTVFTVVVTSELGWSASTSSSWLTFSPATGTSGTSTITVNVSANNLFGDRNGSINVTDGYSTKSCSVTQAGVSANEYPIVTYHNIITTASTTQINHWGIGQESEYWLGDTMVVDNQIVPISGKYQFSTTGQHIVRWQWHGYPDPIPTSQSTIRYPETLSLSRFDATSLTRFEVSAPAGSWFRDNITAVTHTIGEEYGNWHYLCYCRDVDLRNSALKRVYGVFLGEFVENLYLPSSITTFLDSTQTGGNASFNQAHNLSNIYCYATTPPDLGSMSGYYMFPINDSASQEASAYTGVARVGTLHVPAGSVAAYQSAWMKNQKGYLGYQPVNPRSPRYNWTVVGDL